MSRSRIISRGLISNYKKVSKTKTPPNVKPYTSVKSESNVKPYIHISVQSSCENDFTYRGIPRLHFCDVQKKDIFFDPTLLRPKGERRGEECIIVRRQTVVLNTTTTTTNDASLCRYKIQNLSSFDHFFGAKRFWLAFGCSKRDDDDEKKTTLFFDEWRQRGVVVRVVPPSRRGGDPPRVLGRSKNRL